MIFDPKDHPGTVSNTLTPTRDTACEQAAASQDALGQRFRRIPEDMKVFQVLTLLSFLFTLQFLIFPTFSF